MVSAAGTTYRPLTVRHPRAGVIPAQAGIQTNRRMDFPFLLVTGVRVRYMMLQHDPFPIEKPPGGACLITGFFGPLKRPGYLGDDRFLLLYIIILRRFESNSVAACRSDRRDVKSRPTAICTRKWLKSTTAVFWHRSKIPPLFGGDDGKKRGSIFNV